MLFSSQKQQDVEEKTEEEEITQKEKETEDGGVSKSNESNGKKKVRESSSMLHRHFAQGARPQLKFGSTRHRLL